MRCFTREVMLEGSNRPQPVLLLVGCLVAAILRGMWSAEGEVGVGVNTLQAKMQCVTRSLSVYTSNGTGGGSAVELLTLS